MKGKTTAGTQAIKRRKSKTDEEGKTHFVSFNFDEIAKLKETGKDESHRGRMCLRCWRLYFELKILSDFKTGVVGTFRDQKLSYERLAQMVTIPVTKGSTGATRTIDGKEVKRLLDTLAAEGLVTDVSIVDQRLTLKLPLSPIKERVKEATTVEQTTMFRPTEQPAVVSTAVTADSNAVNKGEDDLFDWGEHGDLFGNQSMTEAATSTNTTATAGVRLPTNEPAENAVSACFDRQFGLSGPTASVLTSIKSQYPFSVLSQAEHSSASVRAEGTDPFRKGCEGSRSLLDAEQIRERMRGQCKDAVWLDTRDSATFFKQMAGLDVEADVLDKVLAKLNADATAIKSPAALFDALVKEQQAIRRRRANLRSY